MRSATILIVFVAASVNHAAQPNPVSHTANFAGQGGWSTDTSTPAAGSNYDRYGQPIGTTSPPPSITSRAQQAVTETGTTLREGFDAGVRAANDQLQSFGNNVRSSAEQTFGVQPIGSPGSTASPPTSSTTPRAKNGVAPPPWSTNASSTTPNFPNTSAPASTSGQFVDRTISPGMTPSRTDTGWTSIGAGVAAPPLLIPQLPTSTNNASQPRLAATGNGPTFPSITSSQPGESPQTRSLLTNNSSQPAARGNAANDWASGWTNNNADSGATIGRSNNNAPSIGSTARNSDLVAVEQLNSNPKPQDARPQPNGTNWDDPWGGANSWSGQNSQQPAAATNVGANQAPSISANQTLASNPNGQSPATQTAASPAAAANAAVAAPPAANIVQLPVQNRDSQVATSAQPQWLTLAVVLLSLVGSLSANVFLGMSYMDARQKYQSLVRRTADSFRRTSPAAA